MIMTMIIIIIPNQNTHSEWMNKIINQFFLAEANHETNKSF